MVVQGQPELFHLVWLMGLLFNRGLRLSNQHIPGHAAQEARRPYFSIVREADARCMKGIGVRGATCSRSAQLSEFRQIGAVSSRSTSTSTASRPLVGTSRSRAFAEILVQVSHETRNDSSPSSAIVAVRVSGMPWRAVGGVHRCLSARPI